MKEVYESPQIEIKVLHDINIICESPQTGKEHEGGWKEDW